MKRILLFLLAALSLSAKTNSTIGVQAAPSPSSFGASVSLLATVSPSAATGVVTFYDGVTVLGSKPVFAGQAALATIALTAGSHQLTAYYGGDANYNPSTSAAVAQTVSAGAASGYFLTTQLPTTLGVSAQNAVPAQIAVGDFNGDGKPDIAVPFYGLIVVATGVGDGTFINPVSYAISSVGLLTGDFNGDGKLDLATDAGILLGNGNGTFSSPTAYSTATTVLAVSDFNLDGKADLVTTAGILLGNGNGTFGSPHPFTGSFAALADFNGDGEPDLAVVDSTGTYLTILFGNGDGSFSTGGTYTVTAGSSNFVAADFNGDGKPDLALLSSSLAHPVFVLLNKGNGSFGAPVQSPVQINLSNYVSAATGDFNGDGKADLVVSSTVQQLFLLGNSDGTFTAGQSVTAGGVSNIAVADFNGDGVADLALAEPGIQTDSGRVGNGISILLATKASATSPFVTGETLGPIRNNYTGNVGMEFTVGVNPISISALGRFVAPGNSQTHQLTLQQVDVTGNASAYASVNLSSSTPGQFQYTALTTPIVLPANTTWTLLSSETSGGDKWYDYGAVTVGSIATVNGPVYTDVYGKPVLVNDPGASYVPVSFQSSATASAPKVTITSPAANATVGGTITLSASASATSPLTITSVQFQLNNNNLGPALTSSPYNLTLDTNTLANGYATLTAIATDSLGKSTISSAVQILVSNGTSSSTPFVTGVPTSRLRTNDYSGFVGMSFTVGNLPLLVTELGRLANGTQTHLIKLVNADGTDVPGGSVSLNLALFPGVQYAYAPLANPIQLHANTSYYLVSQENNYSGGDAFYDIGPVTANSAATISGGVYYSSAYNTPVIVPQSAGYSYVPPNILFTTVMAAVPSVSITAPSPGQVSRVVTVTASAAAAQGLSIASVQFNLNGSSFGVVTSAPYSTKLDTTTLANGTYTLTAVATDSIGNAATSAPVQITISGGSSAVPFLSGQPAGALRNNYSGFVGMEFTTNNTAITITQLGRYVVLGNSQWHVVKLVSSNGVDVPGGAVTLPLNSAIAGQYAYAPLAAPITLTPNTAYFLVSQEVNGGDMWYDYGPVTGTNVASVTAPVYTNSSGAYQPIFPAGYSYVPVNFLYYPTQATSPFLTGQPTSALRNNYTGFVGMQFTVGSKSLTVSQLGRFVVSGNSQTHIVKLVNANGTDVAGGSVTLSLSGAAAGQYDYANLALLVTLQANTTYYLVSQEFASGDQWYELGPVTGSGAAAINGPTYTDTANNFVLVPESNPSSSYVPVNFIYALNQ